MISPPAISRKTLPLAAVVLAFVPACLPAAPFAWMHLGEPDGQKHDEVSYHWLGDGALRLDVAIIPTHGHALDLLWGSKNDERGATITVNGKAQTLTAGGYDGFKWQRVTLPSDYTAKSFELVIEGARPKPAFLAGLRVLGIGSPIDGELPESSSHRITRAKPPLEQWMAELQAEDLGPFERAAIHGRQANEALRRCRKYVDGWLAHADPKSGLIPRNLNAKTDFWNGRDSAADNYAFMVLTCALTDREMFDGRMMEMLRSETKLTSRVGALPADYSFTKQAYRFDDPDINRLIFDGSEYVKDGLMPITEWLGNTAWSERMIAIVDSILEHAPHDTPAGRIPSDNVEVNGEMMQVLSRLCFMTGNDAYLDMACRIADYHLLGERHPTRDVTKLGLRDHNCELISGLTEVYAACHAVRKEKVAAYRKPIHEMLDDILKVGVNEHGLMYDMVNPQTGEVLRNRIGDNWGYNYNGFYTVYLLDGVERYREATRKALAGLKPHYWKFQWQGWGSDGIADSVEGAINLFNREPDVEGVPEWIDANIARMLDIQKTDGVIEGWHGDGNYARTAIMYALWKQLGASVQPWREDVILGAVGEGDGLRLVLSAGESWEGRLVFDAPRHRTVMKMKSDYPRINQFPEWFTASPEASYSLSGLDGAVSREVKGADMIRGIDVRLTAGETKQILVTPGQPVHE